MKLIQDIQNKYNIILASSSQRRKRLLSSIDLQFNMVPPNINERSLYSEKYNIVNYCQSMAFTKAIAVYYSRLGLASVKPNLIISGYTAVVLDDEILFRPKGSDEAITLLQSLSNRSHQIITGVTVLNSISGKINCHYSKTDVYFRKLKEEEIMSYVNTGAPLNRAGGYGLEDAYGRLFINKINGCYNNVYGLPIGLLYIMLSRHI